jgi:hypothetical protein
MASIVATIEGYRQGQVFFRHRAEAPGIASVEGPKPSAAAIIARSLRQITIIDYL